MPHGYGAKVATTPIDWAGGFGTLGGTCNLQIGKGGTNVFGSAPFEHVTMAHDDAFEIPLKDSLHRRADSRAVLNRSPDQSMWAEMPMLRMKSMLFATSGILQEKVRLQR